MSKLSLDYEELAGLRTFVNVLREAKGLDPLYDARSCFEALSLELSPLEVRYAEALVAQPTLGPSRIAQHLGIDSRTARRALGRLRMHTRGKAT